METVETAETAETAETEETVETVDILEPLTSKNVFLVSFLNMNHGKPKVPSPFVRLSCDT